MDDGNRCDRAGRLERDAGDRAHRADPGRDGGVPAFAAAVQFALDRRDNGGDAVARRPQ